MTRLVTALYVPGDRPDRFDKAAASGADLVILDLEDAVAPDRKDGARRNVVAWLATRMPGGPLVEVRVNGSEDLPVFAGLDPAIGVRVPKVEEPADVDPFAGRPVTALLETARGVENAALIAAHPAVTRLALGESDLASDLGSAAAALIDHARIRVLFAARSAGLPAPMLSAFPDIRNLDGLRRDCERGRELGWFGRAAVHPSQLAVIEEVFAATARDVHWARSVLAALDDGGVSTLPSGEMVDAAMAGRARVILERAAETGTAQA
ncbi:CoA ester lyase [Mycetocola sp. 2940]|uniref:HpcH/HpaI aldolase/citrate lyase family protein n=1 Tax=Mycetocola sp. 2940 TaxID=3156452 RepID=UPI00339B5DFB